MERHDSFTITYTPPIQEDEKNRYLDHPPTQVKLNPGLSLACVSNICLQRHLKREHYYYIRSKLPVLPLLHKYKSNSDAPDLIPGLADVLQGATQIWES